MKRGFSPPVDFRPKRAKLSTAKPSPSKEGGVLRPEPAAAVLPISKNPKIPTAKRLIFDSSAPVDHLPSSLKMQMEQATIPRLDKALIQLPRFHSPFNDDVKLDSFLPADMTYAGKQRRGIHENFESCASMRDRVRRALNERFPLAAPIPLPEHIKKAAVFTLVEMKQLEVQRHWVIGVG